MSTPCIPPFTIESRTGDCVLVIGTETVDEYGHKTDGDNDPQGMHGCKHTDTPEWKAHHKRKEVKMKAEETVVVPAPAEAAPTKAIVEVPAAPSAADLSKIAADAGGGSAGLLMAALAVLGGGGAIWKYLNSRDKQKHEERMAEIEQKGKDDQHKQCNVARAALDAKVTELESKLAKIEKKSMSLSMGDFDPEELEDRLKKMEKQMKSLHKTQEE